jgi:hypothetical protein
MKHRILVPVLVLFLPMLSIAQQNNMRWHIQQNGSIEWTIKTNDEHADHIEMSGERVSLIMKYNVDKASHLQLSRTAVFPNFRTKPNDTHGTLMFTFTDADLPRFFLNRNPLYPALLLGRQNKGLDEIVQSINHSGIMQINSVVKDRLKIKRFFLPSTDKSAVVEKLVFTNTNKQACTMAMEYNFKEMRIDTAQSTYGPHRMFIYTLNDGVKNLQQGDSAVFTIVYQAVKNGEDLIKIDVETEINKRIDRVNAIKKPMQLVTPDTVLNTAFDFAKLRVGESVFYTKNGYINSPGGLRYHAAIWANDQAEYSGPYFGYAGNPRGAEAAINAYRWFAKYMNDAYKPIPSSIIAEGEDFWDGAGDRGDQAMIAYGAGRCALAYGNLDSAKVLFPLIEWCLAFSKRKINADGIVESDSDELEGRFPAGKANLCTSSLYYDALLSAAYLSKELGKPKAQTDSYLKQAADMKNAINTFFGAKVEGFETYRYYKENDILRAWICIPLTMGIFERQQGTIEALFSPRLWSENGLVSQAGDKTFWDRSTLYALRGAFASGETDKALTYLTQYSQKRLLGEHVPYPVEAYPEGNQTHLSTESALYCRIYTEGLFGIRPMGLRSFTITPKLPSNWNEMSLLNNVAFGNTFDIVVKRKINTTEVTINRNGKKPITKNWNGKSPLLIEL